MEAAAWLGYKKTDYPDIPLWWIHKAINYMSAEGEAQKEIADRRNNTR
jgi:hypothetical protein